MSSLAARLDEIIVLYTLDRMTVRAIADRYGATAVTVKMLLVGAGVELMQQPRRPGCTRGPLEGPPERLAPVRRPESVTVYEPGDLIPDDDRRHVRAVIAALGGKGFPFVTSARPHL